MVTYNNLSHHHKTRSSAIAEVWYSRV